MDLLQFVTNVIHEARKHASAAVPNRWLLLIVLTMALPSPVSAEWHMTGLLGTLTRLQADRLDFLSFRSGPVSTTSPTFAVEGGRSIWKLTVDGTLLSSSTGMTEVFIGPALQTTRTTRGHALLLDGGAEWPISNIGGFRLRARAGYGTARVHVPTEIPIDDHRQFWTYGFVGTREFGRRYLLRLDIRNAHFRREEIPETLGRFNVMALAGFGLRF